MAESIIANLSNSSGSISCKYKQPDSDTKVMAKRIFVELFVLLGITFNVWRHHTRC